MSSASRPLVVFETHPVQYHAPVYRAVAAKGVPIVVVYGSDFSVVGYKDREFGTSFAWDTDLLSGYHSRFLNRVGSGEPATIQTVSAEGMERELNELNPLAVLACGYASDFDRAAIRAARHRNVPMLLRAETADHAKNRSWLKSRVRDWILRRLYRQFSMVLNIGSRSREHYLRLGVPPHKMIRAAYCVDPSPFRTTEADRTESRERVRKELGISANQIILLFSGKIVPRKGVDLLVPAIRNLPCELQKKFVLAFLGDGEWRDRIANESKQDPAISVRFLGFQNQSKLSEFYHAADLLVLPSRVGETWGLVVNDALHHGLPAIVSDSVGCSPDLVASGETGEVFHSGDVQSLSAALTKAIELTDRADIRDKCRIKVSEYSVENAADGIVSAFHTVVG